MRVRPETPPDRPAALAVIEAAFADILGVLPPEPAWGANFLIQELNGSSLPTGTFRYASVFEAL